MRIPTKCNQEGTPGPSIRRESCYAQSKSEQSQKENGSILISGHRGRLWSSVLQEKFITLKRMAFQIITKNKKPTWGILPQRTPKPCMRNATIIYAKPKGPHTMTIIYQRTYEPQAKHFTRCLSCGRETFPFPHENSGSCPICYYTHHCQHEPERNPTI